MKSITKITTTNVVTENAIVGHDQAHHKTEPKETKNENKNFITIIMAFSI